MDRASLGGGGGGGGTGGGRRSRSQSRGSMTPRQTLRAPSVDVDAVIKGQHYSTQSSSSDGIDAQSALYESIDEGVYDQGLSTILSLDIGPFVFLHGTGIHHFLRRNGRGVYSFPLFFYFSLASIRHGSVWNDEGAPTPAPALPLTLPNKQWIHLILFGCFSYSLNAFVSFIFSCLISKWRRKRWSGTENNRPSCVRYLMAASTLTRCPHREL